MEDLMLASSYSLCAAPVQYMNMQYYKEESIVDLKRYLSCPDPGQGGIFDYIDVFYFSR